MRYEIYQKESVNNKKKVITSVKHVFINDFMLFFFFFLLPSPLVFPFLCSSKTVRIKQDKKYEIYQKESVNNKKK